MNQDGSDVLLGGGGVVSFSSGMSGLERRDILDCLRYSEIRANKSYDREQDWSKWINAYQGGMLTNGFTLNGALLHDVLTITNAGEVRAEIGNAVEAVVSRELSDLAATALASMLDSPHANAFFKDWSSVGRSKSLHRVPCRKEATGFIDVMICSLQMQTDARSGTWLDPLISLARITIDGGAFTYSAEGYAPYRDQVRKEVREYSATWIESLP